MPTKEIYDKLHRLLDLQSCFDENYQRKAVIQELRLKIIEDQKELCWLCKCKTTIPMIHHIQPDGESILENLIMLCPLCHQWVHWMLKKYLGYRGTGARW